MTSSDGNIVSFEITKYPRLLKEEFDNQHLGMVSELDAQRMQLVENEQRVAALTEASRTRELLQGSGDCVMCHDFEQEVHDFLLRQSLLQPKILIINTINLELAAQRCVGLCTNVV